MKNPTIQVILNRWFYLDEDGEPATRIMNEEGFGYIGASVIQAPGSADTTEKVLAYSDKPVELTASRYVRKLVVSGVLIPANEESARVAGVTFVVPHERMNAAKNKALEEFDAQHGKGAWAALHTPQSPLVADSRKASE